MNNFFHLKKLKCLKLKQANTIIKKIIEAIEAIITGKKLNNINIIRAIIAV